MRVDGEFVPEVHDDTNLVSLSTASSYVTAPRDARKAGLVASSRPEASMREFRPFASRVSLRQKRRAGRSSQLERLMAGHV